MDIVTPETGTDVVGMISPIAETLHSLLEAIGELAAPIDTRDKAVEGKSQVTVAVNHCAVRTWL